MAIHIRKYYFAYVSKRQIEIDVYRVVLFKYLGTYRVIRPVGTNHTLGFGGSQDRHVWGACASNVRRVGI